MDSSNFNLPTRIFYTPYNFSLTFLTRGPNTCWPFFLCLSSNIHLRHNYLYFLLYVCLFLVTPSIDGHPLPCGEEFFCVAKLSQVTYTLLKEYLFFFTVKSTGSLGASTFYCKLTETVKWKRYCIFTDWYQFICKNLKTIMAYLVC